MGNIILFTRVQFIYLLKLLCKLRFYIQNIIEMFKYDAQLQIKPPNNIIMYHMIDYLLYFYFCLHCLFYLSIGSEYSSTTVSANIQKIGKIVPWETFSLLEHSYTRN